MAVIKEELILYDKFTKTFTSYIRMAQQAASASTMAASGAQTAARATEQFTQSQKSAQNAASGLARTLKSLAGTYFGMQGIKTLVNMSDQVSQIDARLKLMTGSEEAAAAAQDQIYAAAMRSRGAYTEMANLVSQLGMLAPDAFTDTGQTVAFAEQLQKQMALSGTSKEAGSAAVYQLTQALSSGVLRGEELNSVMEQTPMIAKTIADYMGVTTGELREMASQGQVTADVVKNAILGAAAETDKAFAQLPMTWAQVWTMAQNIIIRALGPVLDGINWLANNIKIIGPLVLGLAGAFAVFQVAAHWTQIAAVAAGVYKAAVTLLSIGFGVLTGSTAASSAAVLTFNSALLASPITWAVMVIALLVGALYAGVAAFNKLTGSSVSATGIITGALAGLASMALNIFVIPMQRAFAMLANFFMNVFNDPVAAVKMLFYQWMESAIGCVLKVAEAIESLLNKIPGVSVDMTSWLNNLHTMVKAGAEKVKSESGWKEYVKSWDYRDIVADAAAGYNWGANLSLSGMTGMASTGNSEIPEYLSQIAGDTKSIKNSVSATEEDLQMMVDMAERRFVATVNLNAPAPVIQIQGQNTGNSRADTRHLMNELARFLQEDMNAGTMLNYSTI